MPKLVDVVRQLWLDPERIITLGNGLKLRIAAGRVRKRDGKFTRSDKYMAETYRLYAWSERPVDRDEIGVLIKHAREAMQAAKPNKVFQREDKVWVVEWGVRPIPQDQATQGRLL